MTLDALAGETQFADHLAPVWHALPVAQRGRFLVDPAIAEHVRGLGINPAPAPRPVAVPTVPRLDGPPLLVASYGDIKVGRRLGYGPFAFIEHGAGQSYAGDRNRSSESGSYAGGPDRDDVTLFMVPNEHSADRWRAAYPQAEVAVVGSPHIDALPRREPGPGPVVAISFHWPCHLAPETDTALGEYLPVLPDLASRFSVIGHAHPKGDWPRTLQRYYQRAGIPFVADFADVCRQADVYVCDNSSTLFEFAATGRPVVVLNSKHYRRNVNHGLRFWDAASVGMQVDKPGDLVETVQAALNDPWDQQQAREDALRIVYGVRTNGAAYAATAILDWMAARVGVAA